MLKLLNEQDAIKQAVGAGYERMERSLDHDTWAGGEDVRRKTTHEILQDPAFWQALGKAREWDYWEKAPGEPLKLMTDWKAVALRYFETLLSGGDMQKFWENLP